MDSGHRRIRFGLVPRAALIGVVIVGLVGALAGGIVTQLAAVREADERQRRAADVSSLTQAVLAAVVDMETGTRGFALTRQDRFLEPWLAGRERLTAALRALPTAAALDPQAPVGEIDRLGDRAVTYASDYSVPLVNRVRRGEADATAVAEGKRRVDEMRRAVASITTVQESHEQRADATDDRSRQSLRRFALAGLALTGLILLLVLWYVVRSILRPVSRLSRGAEALRNGALHERIPRGGTRELDDLAAAFNAMANSLEEAEREAVSLNLALERQVRQRSAELEAARLEQLERLAVLGEFRDEDTQEHAARIGRTAALIAEQLGLGARTVECLRRAAPLHDIGKVAVPDAILLKSGRLTEAEFATMRTHTTVGARMLSGSPFEVLQTAEVIARSHHERWDGRGYPDGLAGEDIPIAARIVSVADVFDALTHERPYKAAWSVADAVAEIRRNVGAQFDAAVVTAFLAVDLNELQAPVEAVAGSG